MEKQKNSICCPNPIPIFCECGATTEQTSVTRGAGRLYRCRFLGMLGCTLDRAREQKSKGRAEAEGEPGNYDHCHECLPIADRQLSPLVIYARAAQNVENMIN